MSHGGRLLFVFLDGVGIGERDGERNPFARAEIPTLQELMGGSTPTLDAPYTSGPLGHAFPLDATLGVPGTPQSGTGQATLLTGVNAAARFGRHFGPWTPVSLRPLVENWSLLRIARDAGLAVAFANAYPRGWPGARGGRRVAGPPLAARGAGLLDRHEEALADGTAVSSEIVNEGWRRHPGHDWIPEVSEEDAGRTLAAIASAHDLTLYAHYATDTAGHRGGMDGAVASLQRVDRFLSGLMGSLPQDTTLLIASDHGNLEDVRAEHTRNPSLGVAAGPSARRLAESLTSIRDVAAASLSVLGVPVPS
ncbi:MAG TPA: alkaline phosphatase family protein [Longimicrobiales bacterium]|nr:alkaline phosphatase family protein [Longimicrobiales bacterium]